MEANLSLLSSVEVELQSNIELIEKLNKDLIREKKKNKRVKRFLIITGSTSLALLMLLIVQK